MRDAGDRLIVALGICAVVVAAVILLVR